MDNPFFGRRRRQPTPSGPWACATRSPSRSTPTAPACSSTTSARSRGRRSTPAMRAPTTAGPPWKGLRRATPHFANPALRLPAQRGRAVGLRDRGRGLPRHGEGDLAAGLRRATTSSPTSAAAGSTASIRPRRARADPFATGIAQPGGPHDRAGRRPLLPVARDRRRASAASPPTRSSPTASRAGDLAAWAAASTDGGDLTVTGAAALDGTRRAWRRSWTTSRPLYVQRRHAQRREPLPRALLASIPTASIPAKRPGISACACFLAFEEAPGAAAAVLARPAAARRASSR